MGLFGHYFSLLYGGFFGRVTGEINATHHVSTSGGISILRRRRARKAKQLQRPPKTEIYRIKQQVSGTIIARASISVRIIGKVKKTENISCGVIAHFKTRGACAAHIVNRQRRIAQCLVITQVISAPRVLIEGTARHHITGSAEVNITRNRTFLNIFARLTTSARGNIEVIFPKKRNAQRARVIPDTRYDDEAALALVMALVEADLV